jgi:hypothetical protein
VRSGETKKVTANVAKALANVPIDNKQERDELRARVLQKVSELKALESGMSREVRGRFEELGELLALLDECESRPPQKRSF